MSPPRIPIEDRFWQKVAVGSPERCWPWLGGKVGRGYGKTTVEGRSARANRVAYTLAHGPIPDGAVVRHTCDNPPCCNPAHLITGTHADNSADAVERGRTYRGIRHHRARLTPEDVRAIRLSRNGGQSFRSLAADYGVSKTAIQHVIYGRSWAHVAEESA